MKFRARRMHRPKRWIIAPPHENAGELAGRLKTSPVIAQILLNRGISQAEECFNFLRPSLKCLHDPALIPNLMKAAEACITPATILHPWNRELCEEEDVVSAPDWPTLARRLEPVLA